MLRLGLSGLRGVSRVDKRGKQAEKAERAEKSHSTDYNQPNPGGVPDVIVTRKALEKTPEEPMRLLKNSLRLPDSPELNGVAVFFYNLNEYPHPYEVPIRLGFTWRPFVLVGL